MVRKFFLAGLGSGDLSTNILDDILYSFGEGFGIAGGRVVYRLDGLEPYVWVEPVVCKFSGQRQNTPIIRF